MPRHTFIALASLALVTPPLLRADPPAKTYPQRTITTLHFDLQTDVSNELAAEAYIRMDRMFEEYNERTAAFAKPINGRFTFQLFATQAEYTAAGGTKGTQGIFSFFGPVGQLQAFITPGTRQENIDYTWHVIQHEGFHLFAWGQISASLPPWINEGLAEYYGEALFTGDGYISGVVPKARVDALLARAKANKILPFAQFRAIDAYAWIDKINHDNYDQAWSMAHFLIHGDNAKYFPAFNRYMTMLSTGNDPEPSWHAVFGPDNGTFERAWFAYYQNLNIDAVNTPLLEQAATATVASFLARAKASGLAVATVDDLLQLEKSGKLIFKPDAEHWLPASLLDQRLAAVKPPTWTVTWTGPIPTVKAQFPDGAAVTTTFTQQNKVWRTKTTLTAPPSKSAATAPSRTSATR